MVTGEKSTEELRRHLQTVKMASAQSRMESIDATLSPDVLQLVNQSRDKGASSVPLVDQGLVLNKQEFRDSRRLRYNMPLSDLPSQCVCDRLWGEIYCRPRPVMQKRGGCSAETRWCS